MYDHERRAYSAGSTPGLGQLLVSAQNFAKVADGYIVPTALCLEPIGSDPAPAAPTNEVVRSFLENVVSQYGSKSVLFISFEYVFRVNSSGKGLVCELWVEQRVILRSGAVGWLLTHGGYNSMTESLSQAIPLIVWPINAEQPLNTSLLATGPNPVAIELLQVRTGPQRAPSLRGGPEITGTVEAATAEFAEAFAATRGPRHRCGTIWSSLHQVNAPTVFVFKRL
ncbi:hypothetical protein DFH09DRAFT_1305321 [Mycena vulgaris]|nr:hypothetical protein DFH09DRAFT_1305321 [Mycena vulgaris]